MHSPLNLTRFRPRLMDALAGYDRERFFKDLGAGATVGIVALPLAMAFAIASGLKPEAGIWTAIIAGFLISLLGGSAVQIGGPAGAFIVIVYGIVERYGVANLLIATACAGVLLFMAGLFGLGRLVRFVPLSIVVGFTNGIAVLILLSQLKDLLGLTVAKMPADVFSQLHAMALQIGTFNPYAFALGIACVAGLLLWPLLLSSDSKVGTAVLRVAGRVARTRAVQVGARMPGPIVALVTLTLVSWGFELPVETIGTRFGGIPEGVPAFALPDFSWETVKQLVTPTLTIALLGAIESLLCARVSDQLSGQPRHDPNQELMAQGIANIVTPFFGGMPATGTIARTVTNIRSGGTSPIAGIVHAITLLAVVLLAAPLARHVPLAVLAGILVFVGLNMGEWREFTPTQLRHFSRHYRLLMLGTFFLTVVFDLTVAVQVGIVLACALFIRRMNGLFSVELVTLQPPVLTYSLYGALFFGAAAKLDEAVNAAERAPRGMTVVLDATHLIYIDATGVDALRQLHRAVLARDGLLRIESLQPQPLEVLVRSGFAEELTTGQPGASHGA
ncbi:MULTISPECIES: SulP family inorganic anion transporter [unclassified Variovorax]|jgi:SulP family sulfate permease|uniref:SulP family inorganic anion transporter n=1 Tax=unclassified Variovorax TaxID=663243 RepID=UPI000896D0A6|nr:MULTISPECIES: SulP family inorganic anion transporter [unclassified Variovorax]SDY96825.1 sulfate permease, SulP family [Variovorax sp. YR634]SET67899.1 sulfate permease, SulP family [Variovorax sp. OV084]